MTTTELLIMLGVFAAILAVALTLKKILNPEEPIKPKSKEEIIEEEMNDLIKHDANSKPKEPENKDDKKHDA